MNSDQPIPTAPPDERVPFCLTRRLWDMIATIGNSKAATWGFWACVAGLVLALPVLFLAGPFLSNLPLIGEALVAFFVGGVLIALFIGPEAVVFLAALIACWALLTPFALADVLLNAQWLLEKPNRIALRVLGINLLALGLVVSFLCV